MTIRASKSAPLAVNESDGIQGEGASIKITDKSEADKLIYEETSSEEGWSRTTSITQSPGGKGCLVNVMTRRHGFDSYGAGCHVSGVKFSDVGNGVKEIAQAIILCRSEKPNKCQSQ